MPRVLSDLIPLSPFAWTLRLREGGLRSSLELRDAHLYPWMDAFGRTLGVVVEQPSGPRLELWVTSPALWERLRPLLEEEPRFQPPATRPLPSDLHTVFRDLGPRYEVSPRPRSSLDPHL